VVRTAGDSKARMGRFPRNAPNARVIDAGARDRSEGRGGLDGPRRKRQFEHLHANFIGKPSSGSRNTRNGFCELTRQNCGRDFYGYSQVIERKERETGIEPATSSLGSWHSTAELLPLVEPILADNLQIDSRDGAFRPSQVFVDNKRGTAGTAKLQELLTVPLLPVSPGYMTICVTGWP
jgi:hypothetical protein